MEMTIEDICKEYRTSKNRKDQINILAQLNSCRPMEIVEILKNNGEHVDMRWFQNNTRKKKIETPEQAMPAPETPERPEIHDPVITAADLMEILREVPPTAPVMLVEGDRTVMAVTFQQEWVVGGNSRWALYID